MLVAARAIWVRAAVRCGGRWRREGEVGADGQHARQRGDGRRELHQGVDILAGENSMYRAVYVGQYM